jgi:hypothetical protein
VFVGRIELLPEYLKQTLTAAIASTDKKTLDRFGRFYSPFAATIGAKAPVETVAYMNAKIARAWSEAGSACK